MLWIDVEKGTPAAGAQAHRSRGPISTHMLTGTC